MLILATPASCATLALIANQSGRGRDKMTMRDKMANWTIYMVQFHHIVSGARGTYKNVLTIELFVRERCQPIGMTDVLLAKTVSQWHTMKNKKPS